jgi:hypothetical protein
MVKAWTMALSLRVRDGERRGLKLFSEGRLSA